VEIGTKEVGRRPTRACPACGSRLRRVRNRTLYGGTVPVGFRCTSCSYATGNTASVPTKYVFRSALPLARGERGGF